MTRGSVDSETYTVHRVSNLYLYGKLMFYSKHAITIGKLLEGSKGVFAYITEFEKEIFNRHFDIFGC